MGVEQVKGLCQCRQEEMAQWLHLIAADAKYGNHRFFGPLKDEPCGALARLRRDRVLYGEPGAYSGRGRPRVHGERFAFKEPETWGKAEAMVELENERWGKVRLRRWDGFHARQDATTPFSVILVETHLSETSLPSPFGWAISRRLTRNQETNACKTCGTASTSLARRTQHSFPQAVPLLDFASFPDARPL